MRVLVCGDRNWRNRQMLDRELSYLHWTTPITVLIEGEARGADTMAREWAERHRVPVLRFPAQWEKFGRAAGPIRNRQMLVEGKPDLVVAFHENLNTSKGTLNMVRLAQVHSNLFGKVGLPVLVFPQPER